MIGKGYDEIKSFALNFDIICNPDKVDRIMEMYQQKEDYLYSIKFLGTSPIAEMPQLFKTEYLVDTLNLQQGPVVRDVLQKLIDWQILRFGSDLFENSPATTISTPLHQECMEYLKNQLPLILSENIQK